MLQEGAIDLLWLRIPTYAVMSVHLLPDNTVQFRSTAGTMAISGQAQVHPAPGGSLVDYQAILKPETFMPIGIAQSLVTGYIRKQMNALQLQMLRAK